MGLSQSSLEGASGTLLGTEVEAASRGADRVQISEAFFNRWARPSSVQGSGGAGETLLSLVLTGGWGAVSTLLIQSSVE